MTSHKGRPFQNPRSFLEPQTSRIGVLPSVFIHIPSHLRNLLSPEEIHFICHNTTRKVFLILIWNLSSCNLPPAVSVLTPWFHTQSLIRLFCGRQPLEYWKHSTRPPSLSSAHPAFMLSGLPHHPGHLVWILALYLGLNSTIQDSFNNTVKGLHPFSECFYQCSLILWNQTLLETSVSTLSDLRKHGTTLQSGFPYYIQF